MKQVKEYFQAIREVSDAFATIHDRDKLLKNIVGSIVRTMKGKAACLYLMEDGNEERFSIGAQVGMSKTYIHESSSEHIKQDIKKLKKEGFVLYRDVENDPRIKNKQVKKKEGIKSILVVPVAVQGKVIGSLAFYTGEVRDFSALDIEFLGILAEQGGIAIENARLLQQTRDISRIFLDIASQIVASTDIKSILAALTEDVAKAVHVKASTIRLLDDARMTLRLAASYGLSDSYLHKGPISAEKSIKEALQGKPVVVSDASKDAGVQYREEKKAEGIVTILCVPIKSRDEIIGVLRLYSGTSRKFTEDEIQFVTAIAYMGGVAIQNMELQAGLQSDIKDLREDVWIFKSWF